MGVKRFSSTAGSMYYPSSKRSKAAVPTTTTMKRIAKRAIEKTQEVKSVSSSSTSAPGITGAVQLMPLLAQGVDDGQRIGDSVTIKEIVFLSQINTSAIATASDTFRTLIVYDRQANGAAPTFANVLTDNTGSGNLVTATHNTQYIPPTGGMGKPRFKILYDKTNAFAHNTTTTGNQQTVVNKITLKKLNLKMNFIGTGATVASIGSGSVYLFTVATNNTNTSSTINQWDIHYTDA